MAKIVGGTILDTNLNPIASCPVEIELVLAQGFAITGKYSLAPVQVVQTTAAGTWTATLVENDGITPAGTLYQVTEKIPIAHGGSKNYLIQVLTSLGGGTNQVLDLVVPTPGAVGTVNNYITKAYADATYSPVGTSVGPPGPAGATGGSGAAGYLPVANRAALDALTPVSGLLVLQTDRMIYWTWNGSKYVPVNDPVFTTTGIRDAAFTAPNIGDSYYFDSNDLQEGPIYRNHAGQYRLPWNMPWGEVAYVDSSSMTGGIVGSVVDLTGLSLTFTGIANRKYMCLAKLSVLSSNAAELIWAYLSDGASVVKDTAKIIVASAGISETKNLQERVITGAGTITRKLAAQRVTGAGTVQAGGEANCKASILILDIGPSGAPA